MAFARVEIIEGWPREQKAIALEKVRGAISAALRVPPDDPTVLLVEHSKSNVAVPMGLGAAYTLVTVTMFSGRSDEAKRGLVTQITEALVEAGAVRGEIDVLLQEQPRQHWARGAHLASDRDPGFKVDI